MKSISRSVFPFVRLLLWMMALVNAFFTTIRFSIWKSKTRVNSWQTYKKHALWLLTSSCSRTFAASAAVAINSSSLRSSSRADADSSFSISCRTSNTRSNFPFTRHTEKNCHKVVVFWKEFIIWGLLFTQEFHDLSVDVCHAVTEERLALHVSVVFVQHTKQQ